MSRWIIWWDPKKREEEERAWKESQKKKIYKNQNPEKIEMEENIRKHKQAEEYIKQNPTETGRIQELAYSRALILVKGKEHLVKPLLNWLFYKIAFEESEKIKINTVIN